MNWRRAVWWVVPVVLLAAAAYQLALALGAYGVGAEPGEGAPGQGVVEAVALLGIVVALMSPPISLALRSPAGPALALYAPAAAAFVAASFYTYDPYFAPNLRRFSDDGAISPSWVWFLVGLSLAVGGLTARYARVGSVVTPVAVFLTAWTFFFMGSH